MIYIRLILNASCQYRCQNVGTCKKGWGLGYNCIPASIVGYLMFIVGSMNNCRFFFLIRLCHNMTIDQISNFYYTIVYWFLLYEYDAVL